MKILFIIVALFLLLDNTYSGTIDPSVDDSVYIKHANNFKCVGKLCGTYSDNTFFCASAVAISDNIIITAAHVVKNATKCFITINDKKICVQKFVYKKEFDINNFGENDIAIGFCDEPIGLDEYPELYDTDDEENKQCDIVGFGMTGTFLTGVLKSDDFKRAGSNTIDNTFKDTIVCSPSKKTDDNYTDKEFLIASGDSGGGLFIDSKLAGINSMVMAKDKNPNSSYTDESCHTRISLYKEWIKQNIKY